MYRIPVDNSPNQEFDCKIPVDGKNIDLHFRLNYNETAGYWVMSLNDNETGSDLLSSIPLVTGINILGQYSYLGIGSAYLVKIGDSLLDYPNSVSLGNEFSLLWGDTVG